MICRILFMQTVYQEMIVVYKLLVVDDEPRQVKALANIISRFRPCYDVFYAEDGQEALELITQKRIDILITDIKMPNMDGLALIEKLTGMDLKIKTIILSGYGEFEYAQKAIHFGVNDYLVKPVSKGDLHSLIVKMENSIKEDQERRRYQENLQKTLHNSLPVYIGYQFNKWVSGALDGEGIKEIESIFPHKGPGVVIVTSFAKSRSFSDNSNACIEEVDRVLQYGEYLMKETLNTFGECVSFYVEGYTDVMATVLSTDQSVNLLSYDNVKKLYTFIDEIRNKYEMVATLGVSKKSECIFKDISRCFMEASVANKRRFYLGVGKVIHYSDPSYGPRNDSIPPNLSVFEAELSEAIRQMNTSLLIKTTGRIFEEVDKRCWHDPERLKESWTHLVLNLLKILYPMMSAEEYEPLIEKAKNMIAGCDEYRELWHSINEILCDAVEMVKCKADGSMNGIIIEKCKKYIENNYMNAISLESVAQKYCFNSSYFSNLFKNHTGSSFSKYLHLSRIKEAQSLLENTDESITEISIKVGFKDCAYFCRVFKRETGLSPLKYRQIHEGGMGHSNENKN